MTQIAEQANFVDTRVPPCRWAAIFYKYSLQTSPAKSIHLQTLSRPSSRISIGALIPTPTGNALSSLSTNLKLRSSVHPGLTPSSSLCHLIRAHRFSKYLLLSYRTASVITMSGYTTNITIEELAARFAMLSLLPKKRAYNDTTTHPGKPATLKKQKLAHRLKLDGLPPLRNSFSSFSMT
jgi:hypothetical protein